jgi:hypothetical protein
MPSKGRGVATHLSLKRSLDTELYLATDSFNLDAVEGDSPRLPKVNKSFEGMRKLAPNIAHQREWGRIL